VYGGEIRLLGYSLDRTAAKPGESLLLRLFWEPETAPTRDYSVFVHVVPDPTHPPVAQKDSLHPGHIRTTRWHQGRYIADVREIPLPEEMPEGDYQLIVGLYDPTPGGQRLMVDDGASYTVLETLRIGLQ
jgi:hypothetical protein